jgi:hypothetical protein
MSIITNMLELCEVIPYSLFQNINTQRGFRNKIVHSQKFEPIAKDAQLSLETAQVMIERQWDFHFTPNTSYSVSGL